MKNQKNGQKQWYKSWWKVSILILLLINVIYYKKSEDNKTQTQSTQDKVYEINNVQINGFSRFISKDWGFSVLFPETPKENILDLDGLTLHSFQAYKTIDKIIPIQYNVFYSDIKNGKILDDELTQEELETYAYNKATLNGGKILTEKDSIFENFQAKEVTFTEKGQNGEMLHKSIMFIVDGDIIELSIVHPSTLNENLDEYENFKKSFQLTPVDPEFSREYPIDTNLNLIIPTTWKKSNLQEEKKLFSFTNEAGHSIELYKAEANNQKASCKDIESAIPKENIDTTGYMYRITPNQDYGINMKMIFRCIETESQGFVLVGKAPENTFFRSSLIFQKTLDSLNLQ